MSIVRARGMSGFVLAVGSWVGLVACSPAQTVDPCALLSAGEAAPYVGPLGTPPYRTSDGARRRPRRPVHVPWQGRARDHGRARLERRRHHCGLGRPGRGQHSRRRAEQGERRRGRGHDGSPCGEGGSRRSLGQGDVDSRWFALRLKGPAVGSDRRERRERQGGRRDRACENHHAALRPSACLRRRKGGGPRSEAASASRQRVRSHTARGRRSGDRAAVLAHRHPTRQKPRAPIEWRRRKANATTPWSLPGKAARRTTR